ncbi:unnamed protein product [Schistosoma intercalatum]|nr:unnamed protein product [Schistosoma intercalatum]
MPMRRAGAILQSIIFLFSGGGFKMGICIWIRSYCLIMLPCNLILVADTRQISNELSSNKDCHYTIFSPYWQPFICVQYAPTLY